MATATVNISAAIGGVSHAAALSRTGTGQISVEEPLPAGKAGTLSTYTDPNTGILTVGSGHGITTQDKVNVFWAGGMRYGMTVTATGETTVEIDAGTGDNLPAQTTAIVVAAQVTINASFDGDDVQAVLASCDKRCHLEFQSSGPATIYAVEIAAGEAIWWASDCGYANPLAAAVTAQVLASAGEASAAALKLGVLYDPTP